MREWHQNCNLGAVLLTAEKHWGGSRLANIASTVELCAKRLGLRHLLLWVVAALGRRFSVHVFVVVVRPIDAEPTDLDAAASGLEARLLTPGDVARFFDREQGHYRRAFAADALARGDRCFGVLQDGHLLWYCWYGRASVPVFDDLNVLVEFPFLYAYNAYTDVAHRSRRLHTIGVAASARFFAREGYRAFTVYIEATNLPPLIASRRMGERAVGFAALRRTARGVRWFTTPGCKTGGFRLMRGERVQDEG
jgi:hypothetical protein